MPTTNAVTTLRSVLRTSDQALLILQSGMRLPEAVRAMERGASEAALVVDNGLVVGLLTHLEIIQGIVGSEQLPDDVRVADVMRRDVITGDLDLPVGDAIAFMTEHRLTCLPVAIDGTVVGLVTALDLARCATNELEGLVASLNLENYYRDDELQDDYGAGCLIDDALGNGAQEDVLEFALAVAAHDDEVKVPVLGAFNDALPGNADADLGRERLTGG